MAALSLNLGLGLSRVRGGESSDMILVYEIPDPNTDIELAIQANSMYFSAGQAVVINWGDGSAKETVSATSDHTGYIGHTYAAEGTYTIKISGSMTMYGRDSNVDIAGQTLLTRVDSFGKLGITSLEYAFYRCGGLMAVPKTVPDSVTNMSSMFFNCSGAAFNPDVSNWDVRNVTNMSYMFYNCSGASFRGGRGTDGIGIANWTPDSFTNAAEFMILSKQQEDGFLDTILITWAALINDIEHPLPENITIIFGTNTYTADASAAISALENHGWVIQSGGKLDPYGELPATFTIAAGYVNSGFKRINFSEPVNLTITGGVTLSIDGTEYYSGDTIPVASTSYHTLTINNSGAEAGTITFGKRKQISYLYIFVTGTAAAFTVEVTGMKLTLLSLRGVGSFVATGDITGMELTSLYLRYPSPSFITGDITGMKLTVLYLSAIGSTLTYGTNLLNITDINGIQLLGDTAFSANEYIQLFADAATCVASGKWTASTKVFTISGGDNPGWSNVSAYYATIVSGGVTVKVPLAWESGDDAFPQATPN